MLCFEPARCSSTWSGAFFLESGRLAGPSPDVLEAVTDLVDLSPHIEPSPHMAERGTQGFRNHPQSRPNSAHVQSSPAQLRPNRPDMVEASQRVVIDAKLRANPDQNVAEPGPEPRAAKSCARSGLTSPPGSCSIRPLWSIVSRPWGRVGGRVYWAAGRARPGMGRRMSNPKPGERVVRNFAPKRALEARNVGDIGATGAD